MKKLFTLAIFMISSVLFTFGQNVTVSGTITDENKDPMFSVNVFVPGTTIGTSSDFDGNFKLSVPKETKSILIKFIGYENVEYMIDASKENQTFNVQLNKLEIGLEQIVISASKRKERIMDAPASVTVLGADKLEKSVAVTAIDNLKNTPGVDIMQTGLVSSNVNIRGFNNIFSGAMLTMVDNRIGSVPSLRVNAFQLIPTSNLDIEKIELIRGPGSALYGPNASSGVMHIITKSPILQEKKFETTLSMVAGVRSNTKFDILGGTDYTKEESSFIDRGVVGPEIRHSGKIGDKFGYKLSGSYVTGNDWKYYDAREPREGDTIVFGSVKNGQVFQADSTIPIGVFNRDFNVKKWNADSRFDFAFTNDIDLTLSGGVAQTTNLELTGLGGAQGRNWIYYYTQARFRWKNLYVQYYFNSSDANDTYLIPQVGVDADPPHNIQLLTDKSKMHTFQIQHSADPMDNLNLIYGADVILTRPNTEGSINGRFEDDDNINQIGGYIQAEYDVHEKVTLVGAARVDYQTPTDEVNVSPRAALVYKPSTRHTTRLTYNRAFSSPTSLNLFLDLSNGTHPVHGFNFRGIGNPNGYQYQIGDDGLAQYIDLWNFDEANPANLQYVNFTDNANSPVYFDNLLAVLKVLFADQSGISPGIINGVVDAIFTGVSGSSGTIKDVGMVGVDFVKLLETGDVAASLWNSDGSIAGLKEQEVVKSSITQTFEAGYKGIIKDKLFLTADVWYTRVNNFSSPLTNSSPTVSFNPNQLNDALAPICDNMNAVIVGLLGFDADSMKSLVQSLNAQVPSGVVTPVDDKVNADVILTYINLGTVDLFGVDLGFNYFVNQDFSIAGSVSLVDKDDIPLEGASGGSVALNAPRFKASLGVNHNFSKIGFGYGVNWRFQNEFPANSAVYVGTVEAAHFLDLTLNYRPKWSQNTRFSVDMSNVLNNEFQPFPGTPFLGRLTMVRATHTFKSKN